MERAGGKTCLGILSWSGVHWLLYPHLPASSQTCVSSLLFPWWPRAGTQLKGLRSKMFNWLLQFSQSTSTIYLKKLVENLKEVKEKKKKTVLGILLCSSLYTNGTSEHYTENVPTKWESIALIWPSPKYSQNFFVQIHSIKLVDGGNGGGQLGREHRKQWQCNSTISTSIKMALNVLDKGCQSKDTSNTHALFFSRLCSLDQVWVTGREEKKFHTLGLK